MSRDKEMGELARRVFECLWGRIPQELKDTIAWDSIIFGSVQPTTQRQFNEVVEGLLRLP